MDSPGARRTLTRSVTGQIILGNKGSKLLISGNSGSLMVQDVATSPRAVGLFFAGCCFSAVANPIVEVLAFLAAAMVGS